MTIFADDMESGDGNWEHMRDFTGDLWHEESFYWICADTYYSWYNAEPSGDYSFYPTQWFVYDETDAGLYRNNMDDKLILSFDLTHAYEAFLEWDQMTGFAGMYPDDYGVVEIWTDGAWKALFIVQGDTLGTWGHMKLDISDYVGGDEFTQVRFRLISNESIVGDGWAVANFSIQGKVDYVNPTCAISLSPATPNGNNGWYTSPVTVTVTGTDNRKVETLYYRIDGGAWKTYSAPFSINIDGEHTVDAYVVDDVGNPSDMCTVTFKIDATAPTVSIDTPQSGYIYFMGRELFKNPLGGTIIIGGITFAATASDAMSGLKKVSFDIDGYSYDKDSSPYEVWWHKFDLLPTKYTLSVSAEDNAGNTASAGTIDFTHWL
ncbi:MAG: hypothetical protein DRN21_06185 [Thermoplasmata archaeon]|nr:MAG: hypothetical protein DRN21_06185 [Thermoplasmata archaeon]